MSAFNPRLSPLTVAWREATALVRVRANPAASKDGSVLYGKHLTRYPLMALMTSREMGPARHAVAQRTVAGTITFIKPQPVPVAKASDPARESS